MTSIEFSNIIDAFLSTLDAFKITSAEEYDVNYVETKALESYWIQNGFEIDGVSLDG